MKKVFSIAAMAATAFTAPQVQRGYDVVLPQSIEVAPLVESVVGAVSKTPLNLREVMAFAEWATAFGKQYANEAERAARAAIFAESLAMITQHNADTTQTFRLGVNQFSDLTFVPLAPVLRALPCFPSCPGAASNQQLLATGTRRARVTTCHR